MAKQLSQSNNCSRSFDWRIGGELVPQVGRAAVDLEPAREHRRAGSARGRCTGPSPARRGRSRRAFCRAVGKRLRWSRISSAIESPPVHALRSSSCAEPKRCGTCVPALTRSPLARRFFSCASDGDETAPGGVIGPLGQHAATAVEGGQPHAVGVQVGNDMARQDRMSAAGRRRCLARPPRSSRSLSRTLASAVAASSGQVLSGLNPISPSTAASGVPWPIAGQRQRALQLDRDTRRALEPARFGQRARRTFRRSASAPPCARKRDRSRSGRYRAPKAWAARWPPRPPQSNRLQAKPSRPRCDPSSHPCDLWVKTGGKTLEIRGLAPI